MSQANESYSQRTTEYSKKWIAEHPELFSNNLLEFMEQHPSDYWEFTIFNTSGFFSICATLKRSY